MLSFNYHKLFDIKYNHRAGKTPKAKRLAVEMNISVREAEQIRCQAIPGQDTQVAVRRTPLHTPL